MQLHRRIAVTRQVLLQTIPVWRAFHRDLPELHATGQSPEEAIGRLADKLVRALEHCVDRIARAVLEEALEAAQSCVCE
jgi:hypothetical protein